MQFSCDSCKTQLQIADEKVRGKRLVVRCRRCGAKITIADPALSGKLTKPVQQPRPSKPAVPASHDEASGWSPKTVSEPAAPAARAATPGREPAAAARRAAESKRTPDSENTMAIDSAMLERALLASKEEDPDLHTTRAPAPDVATPADPPLWFAMLQGKQTGPLSRTDIEDRVANGEVGPRTYLWKEGMDAWQRAKEVPELSSLFPPPPEEQPLAPEPPQAAPEEPVRESEEAPSPAAGDSDADLSSWANSDLAQRTNPQAQNLETPPRPSEPARQRPRSSTPMFEGAAPQRTRGAFGIVIFAIVAAIAVGGLLFFKPDRGQHAQAAAPEVGADAATAEAPPPAVDAGAAEAAPVAETTPSKPAAGLTAEQVRKKLDDHKPALQTCVDEALKRDPKLRAGKIHVVATIAPSGQVTAVKIDKRSIDEAPLGACLKRTTRKIAFPTFSGDPFDVDIPIVVTAGE